MNVLGIPTCHEKRSVEKKQANGGFKSSKCQQHYSLILPFFFDSKTSNSKPPKTTMSNTRWSRGNDVVRSPARKSNPRKSSSSSGSNVRKSGALTLSDFLESVKNDPNLLLLNNFKTLSASVMALRWDTTKDKAHALEIGKFIHALFQQCGHHHSTKTNERSNAARTDPLSLVCSVSLHILAKAPYTDMPTPEVDYIVSFLKSVLLADLTKPPSTKGAPVDYANKVDYTVVRTLSKVLSQFGSKVTSSESIARDVVRPIILLILAPGPNPPTSTPQTTNVTCACLDCLGGLLKHGSHTSALLSPLVIDVLDDGTEVTVVNPLRVKIFEVLDRSIRVGISGGNTKVISSALRAMMIAVEAVGSINRANNAGGDCSSEVLTSFDFQATCQLVNQLLGPAGGAAGVGGPGSNVTFHALGLLHGMGRCFGRQVAVHWDTFLADGGGTNGGGGG